MSTLGLRVVSVPELAGTAVGVLQSSANLAGGADPRSLQDVPEAIRAAAALVIDGGELRGQTLHRRRSAPVRGWTVWGRLVDRARRGRQRGASCRTLLDGQYHFNPATYEDMIRQDLPEYGRLQDELVAGSLGAGGGPGRVVSTDPGSWHRHGGDRGPSARRSPGRDACRDRRERGDAVGGA